MESETEQPIRAPDTTRRAAPPLALAWPARPGRARAAPRVPASRAPRPGRARAAPRPRARRASAARPTARARLVACAPRLAIAVAARSTARARHGRARAAFLVTRALSAARALSAVRGSAVRAARPCAVAVHARLGRMRAALRPRLARYVPDMRRCELLPEYQRKHKKKRRARAAWAELGPRGTLAPAKHVARVISYERMPITYHARAQACHEVRPYHRRARLVMREAPIT